MHQYKGRLVLHTGSMFSGKTSSLEKDLKRFDIAGYKTVCFKPSVDTRVKNTDIITHDSTRIKGVIVSDVIQMKKIVDEYKPDVIGIDEIQFLGGNIGDIIANIIDFLNQGYTVVAAGLDLDFSGEPFEIVKELMPLSDYVYKHHAVCTKCGVDAWVSHRKIKSEERVVIGASDEYEPLCRKCYNEIKDEEEALINKNQVRLNID